MVRELRQAGITARAIDAVWPEWWSSDAESSFSATTELRYTVARRLGMSPRSLFEGPPRFAWRDESKIQEPRRGLVQEAAILSSFGVAVGRCAVAAMPDQEALSDSITARGLRGSILESSNVVDLNGLLAFCWGVGIPVLQLQLFPLSQKRMEAITVRTGDRYVILMGRESKFPAQVAYILAHEIGHIVLGHVSGLIALLDVGDPLKITNADDEEQNADRFTLEVLTGDPAPIIESNTERFAAGS